MTRMTGLPACATERPVDAAEPEVSQSVVAPGLPCIRYTTGKCWRESLKYCGGSHTWAW